MQDLSRALDEIRSRIARYRGSKRLNEQNTKATLIEPVLRALGWNVEDLEEVQREYKVKRSDKPVDYALLLLRTPKLFIEAKALGADLGDRRWVNQIMGYAGVAGVEWIVLTNGDEYRLYNAHAPVAVEDKLFRSFRLSASDSMAKQTLALLAREALNDNRLKVLWRTHFVDRRVRRAMDEIFDSDVDASLVRLLRKKTQGLTPSEIRACLTRAQVSIDFPVVLEINKSRTASPPERSGRRGADVSVPDLIEAGLVHPPLELVRTYKGKQLRARIEPSGQIRVGGKLVDSLSKAGGLARESVLGKRAGKKHLHTNGWTFWQFVDAQAKRRPIDELRKSFRKSRHS